MTDLELWTQWVGSYVVSISVTVMATDPHLWFLEPEEVVQGTCPTIAVVMAQDQDPHISVEESWDAG